MGPLDEVVTVPRCGTWPLPDVVTVNPPGCDVPVKDAWRLRSALNGVAVVPTAGSGAGRRSEATAEMSIRMRRMVSIVLRRCGPAC